MRRTVSDADVSTAPPAEPSEAPQSEEQQQQHEQAEAAHVRAEEEAGGGGGGMDWAVEGTGAGVKAEGEEVRAARRGLAPPVDPARLPAANALRLHTSYQRA
jgi:hypothetical protein